MGQDDILRGVANPAVLRRWNRRAG